MGRFELLELDQKTLRAYERTQRIKRLHCIPLVSADVTVGQGRHAKVRKDLFKGRIAEAARCGHRDEASGRSLLTAAKRVPDLGGSRPWRANAME